MSRPAPASLPSPRTKGIESALNTGPPVTVTEWPVGAVESSVTFSVVSLVFGGVQASAASTSKLKFPAAAFVQLKALESYGPPAGVLTVSSACAPAGLADRRVGRRVRARAAVGDGARERERAGRGGAVVERGAREIGAGRARKRDRVRRRRDVVEDEVDGRGVRDRDGVRGSRVDHALDRGARRAEACDACPVARRARGRDHRVGAGVVERDRLARQRVAAGVAHRDRDRGRVRAVVA